MGAAVVAVFAAVEAAAAAVDTADEAAAAAVVAAAATVEVAAEADEAAAAAAVFAPAAMSVDADAAAAAGSTGGVTGSMLESLEPPPHAAARAKGAKTKYLRIRIGIISGERPLVLMGCEMQRKKVAGGLTL